MKALICKCKTEGKTDERVEGHCMVIEPNGDSVRMLHLISDGNDQAILTVIGRRETLGNNRRDASLDLTRTQLGGATWAGPTCAGQ